MEEKQLFLFPTFIFVSLPLHSQPLEGTIFFLFYLFLHIWQSHSNGFQSSNIIIVT